MTTPAPQAGPALDAPCKWHQGKTFFECCWCGHCRHCKRSQRELFARSIRAALAAVEARPS